MIGTNHLDVESDSKRPNNWILMDSIEQILLDWVMVSDSIEMITELDVESDYKIPKKLDVELD